MESTRKKFEGRPNDQNVSKSAVQLSLLRLLQCCVAYFPSCSWYEFFCVRELYSCTRYSFHTVRHHRLTSFEYIDFADALSHRRRLILHFICKLQHRTMSPGWCLFEWCGLDYPHLIKVKVGSGRRMQASGKYTARPPAACFPSLLPSDRQCLCPITMFAIRLNFISSKICTPTTIERVACAFGGGGSGYVNVI